MKELSCVKVMATFMICNVLELREHLEIDDRYSIALRQYEDFQQQTVAGYRDQIVI